MLGRPSFGKRGGSARTMHSFLGCECPFHRSFQARLLWGRPGLILGPLGRLCQAGPRSAWLHMYDCLCWCLLVVGEDPWQAPIGQVLICDPLDRANLQGQAELACRPKTLWAHEYGHFQPLRQQFFNFTMEGAPPAGDRRVSAHTLGVCTVCRSRPSFGKERDSRPKQALTVHSLT